MKVLFTDSVNTTTELDLLIKILSPLLRFLLSSTCYSYIPCNIYTLFTSLLSLVTKYSFIMNSFIYKELIRLEYHSYAYVNGFLPFLFIYSRMSSVNLYNKCISFIISQILYAIRLVSRFIYICFLQPLFGSVSSTYTYLCSS